MNNFTNQTLDNSDRPLTEIESVKGRRQLTQRIGLVIGLVVFFVVLFSPTIPSLLVQSAGKLQQSIQHEHVEELARGAQATLALTLLMVIWWVTEAVPIPITALLPGVMLPLLHVTGVDEGRLYPFTNKVSFAGYAHPVIYLFLAGFLLAGAMRKTGFDRRITLTFLSWKPATRSPGTIMLCIMAITAFLSMWISNTATTAMMLPIAVGILHELNEKPGRSRFGCALMLGVGWSASFGGIGTLIGSPPNGIAMGILENRGLAEMNFLDWMKFGLPVAVIGVIAAWGLLLFMFRPQVAGVSGSISIFEEQRRSLGKWSIHERFTLAVFVLVVFLWITQPFWKYLLPPGAFETISRLGVYEIGLLCALLLFVVPVDRHGWQPVLNWRDSKYVDWGTLILFGGGIALSNAMFKTGLTDWLAGGFVKFLGEASPWLYLVLIVLLIDFMTEITSNTAVATMMTPILIALAPQLGLNPVLLCIAAAMACSLAFMLPVATPPNALVYSTGYFRISQMMRAGFWMNLIGCGVMVAVLYVLAGQSLRAVSLAP